MIPTFCYILKKIKYFLFEILSYRKKVVILHSQKGNNPEQIEGPLAQLNRASDYGSEGCRFESCTDHDKNL